MDIEKTLKNAFKLRRCPSNIHSSTYTTADGNLIDNVYLDEKYYNTYYFKNKDCWSITIEELEKNSDMAFGTNPEAYCYFLPGILSAAYREKYSGCSAIDSIIWHLQFNDLKSNVKNYAETYYLERWSLLDISELVAVKKWLVWYFSANGISEDDFKVACETIDWLTARKLAENK
jgi:hypothetical protein